MSELPLLPASVVAETCDASCDPQTETLLPLLPAPRLVPTLDDGPGDVDYPDFHAGNSFVVSGPLGAANFRGHRFTKPAEAEAYLRRRYGRVFEFGYVTGRWFGRVPRPGPLGDEVREDPADGVRQMPGGSATGGGSIG